MEESSQEITLSFGGCEGEYETVGVEQLGSERFRLLETAVTADPMLYLGDVIEARMDSEGVHRFQRLIERSGLRVHEWLLARVVAESPEMADYCDEVLRHGGAWERIFGGCFIIHLPADSPFDEEQALNGVLSRVYSRDRGEKE
jgi:hypothetical protein